MGLGLGKRRPRSLQWSAHASLMVDRNRFWRVLVPVVLIVVVLATTMGIACHHHRDHYSAHQCTLCHLVIAPTIANTGGCELAPAIAEYAMQTEFLISHFLPAQIPSRAPPA